MKKNMMHDSITESFLNSLFIGFNIAKRVCLYKKIKTSLRRHGGAGLPVPKEWSDSGTPERR